MTSSRLRALVTGATSGIGAAFAERLAGESYDLVLVARDTDRLAAKANELGQAHGIEVEVITADLSTDQGINLIEDRVVSSEQPIELVVNNAGIGMHGSFVENTVDAHDQLVNLDCRSVLRISRAAAGVMSERRHGDIVNVASVAAYTPSFRPSGTYSASKAFVVSLTEGIAAATRHNGVRASAVCPGFVRTEFHQRAGITMSKLPSFMWLSPDAVVDVALHDMRKGRTVSVPALPYKIIVAASRYLPSGLVRRLSASVGDNSK